MPLETPKWFLKIHNAQLYPTCKPFYLNGHFLLLLCPHSEWLRSSQWTWYILHEPYIWSYICRIYICIQQQKYNLLSYYMTIQIPSQPISSSGEYSVNSLALTSVPAYYEVNATMNSCVTCFLTVSWSSVTSMFMVHCSIDLEMIFKSIEDESLFLFYVMKKKNSLFTKILALLQICFLHSFVLKTMEWKWILMAAFSSNSTVVRRQWSSSSSGGMN